MTRLDTLRRLCFRSKRECDWSLSGCLRSKRKMLGRRDSEDDRHCISSSSSSSSPVSPSNLLPGPARPAALKKSARSESFKALLLRKGGRADLSSRISAVERLQVASAPATNLQSAPSPDQPQVEPISDTCHANSHMTLNVLSSPFPGTQNLTFALKQRVLTPNHPLLTSARPRSLTPPCSASRRFSARCRFYAAPMTAIFEAESEDEEGDDDVFEPPGTEQESSRSLVET